MQKCHCVPAVFLTIRWVAKSLECRPDQLGVRVLSIGQGQSQNKFRLRVPSNTDKKWTNESLPDPLPSGRQMPRSLCCRTSARSLLISAAALPVFRIEPGVECAEAADLTAAAQTLSSAPGVQGLNICAATARRLLELNGVMKSVGRLNYHFCRFQKSCAE